jgi:hypothetical protein
MNNIIFIIFIITMISHLYLGFFCYKFMSKYLEMKVLNYYYY